LNSGHEVTVLASYPATSPALAHRLDDCAHVEVVAVSRARRWLAAAGAVLVGRPGQCGWMMPGPTWRAARRLAGDADVVLVNTSRCMRGPLPKPVVLDHIDALSHNMRGRARGPEPLALRLLLRFEAAGMAHWEPIVARASAVQIAASEDVASMLPTDSPVEVLPNGWAAPIFADPVGHMRDIDLIFTGNMSYPPNRQGAEWLLNDILPRVRAVRPETSAWIVGRDAARFEREGVEVASDVDDLLAYLRRARVAVAPVLGAGSPSKTLEAAANGAAVVSTPWGLDCYGLPGSVATDSEQFAAAILELLDDENRRREQVSDLQACVRELSPERLAPRLERILERARRVRPTSPPAAVPKGGRGTGTRVSWMLAVALLTCAVALTIVLGRGASASSTGSPNNIIRLLAPYPVGCVPNAWPPKRSDSLAFTPPPALNPGRSYVLRLTTNCGVIDIALDVRGAPRATAAVSELVQRGIYDSSAFYRSSPRFLVQAGLRSLGIVHSGPVVNDKASAVAGYPPGTVVMFRGQNDPPGQAGTDFFIVTAANHLPPGYVVLGNVTGGADVVQRIASIPASPRTDGMPLDPIVIDRAELFTR
jgi:cyclophilin family peptidyl-prolyl cis-trans isomerase